MAIIPLHAYNREIEGMIDNGQLDEAVAHCRHILATFPKHIATYRLLGKAHLEQQRISDATDIFQRVLSAIPDDFLGNVGMSIIREDENNLDASIWHMELAYEAQPSNTAIQDELRRLYGRRDGMQPPKVRLTRGALARMYAKGGLLDQAVAELHAAISEDPNRYDLQLLLAEMYYQTSAQGEAIEACLNILKKLPFCLAANQILAVSLPESEHSSMTKNYRQTAISMDPYFAYAAQDAITSDQVPENAVNIERLEWKSGIQMSEVPAQPVWATSLGVAIENKPDDVLPDWLKGTDAPITPEEPEIINEKPQPSVSPFIWDTQEVERIITDDTKQESEIPDWMKDAGWQPASGETIQEPAGATNEPPIISVQPEEELEKADIPDWLRGIAPDGTIDQETPAVQPVEKDVSLPWLEQHQPGPSDSIIQWLDEAKPETPVTPTIAQETPTEIIDEEMPDWLKDLDSAYLSNEAGEKAGEQITPLTLVTPAFIEDQVHEEELKPIEKNEFPSIEHYEQVGSIDSLAETSGTPTIQEEYGAEELPDTYSEELPDWIKELAVETPEEPSSPVPGKEITAEMLIITEEQPTLEVPTALEEMPAIEQLENVEEIPQPDASLDKAEVIQDNLPMFIEEKSRIEQKVASESESGDTSGVTGENAALAWLAGLAVLESKKEEDQVKSTEQEETLPTEWVKLEAETVSAEALPAQEPIVEEAPAVPADEIPDWIKGLGETSEIQEQAEESMPAIHLEPEEPNAEQLPAWLIAAELTEATKETSDQSQDDMVMKEAELPDWIKDIEETAPIDETTVPVELAVTKKLPPLPSEPISELTEEQALEVATGEIETIEAQSSESDWTPEEEPQQPTAEEVLETEADTTFPVEQPVIPSVEIPAAEISTLEDARNAINNGSPEQAAEVYSGMIKHNLHLEEIIKDVQEALYRYPVDINLWVVLGDAHLRTDDLQDALDAYSKAEDLVR
jgi:cytochrome c-type biogenesis protein CcmH/NrfG